MRKILLGVSIGILMVGVFVTVVSTKRINEVLGIGMLSIGSSLFVSTINKK